MKRAAAKRKRSRRVKVYGRHIVADPGICHGKLTFRGTRIFVDTVLEQVAEGLAFEAISENWGGKVTPQAIAEAVRLAHEALRSNGVDPVVETVGADDSA
jgi:uncharacterized protein (DUF433 family)